MAAAHAQPSQPAPAAGRPRHRALVTVLLTVATITGLLAMFAVWANRQALNTDNWTETSSKMLADPKIQDALGAYLVDQLFSNVDVTGELQRALPPRAQVLAAPAAAGLRELADQRAPLLLARPRVQAAWRQANRLAHKQLLRVINGGGSTVSTANGDVTLNVRTIIDQLAANAGVTEQVNAARQKLQGSSGTQARNQVQQKLGITLPSSSGQIVILRSNQLSAAQDVAKAIKGLAVVLTAVSLALFALAVWLASGWRRVALRTTGWCLAGLGLVVLFARRVGGNQLVDALVPPGSTRPAAHDAWSIGTSLLYEIAVAVLVYGIILVAAAWLAGSTRSAVAVRRALAPPLRYHLAAAYGVVALLFLLVLLWGPTPVTTEVWGVLLLVALVVLGVEVLRRQIVREFPEAQAGDSLRRIRARATAMRSSRRGSAAPNARVDELERLEGLHDRGALDDEEFRTQKALVLNGGP